MGLRGTLMDSPGMGIYIFLKSMSVKERACIVYTLSIHVPEYLHKYKSYYCYYKLEQMGQSIQYMPR